MEPTTFVGASTDLPPGPAQRDAGPTTPDAGAVRLDLGVAPVPRLLSDAERQRLLSSANAGQPGASGLVLHVSERGPDQQWMIAVANEGTQPAHLDADTRLFWIDVKVPGVNKTEECRLPPDLLPKSTEPRLDVELDPGEYVAQLIDPRLYCFASGTQKQLVPGARLVPHLGWPELPSKTIWRRGRSESIPEAQPQPFVAHRDNVNIDAALSARKAALKVAKSFRYKKGQRQPALAELGVPLPAGIDKQLTGPELTLRQTYTEWTFTGFASPSALSEREPLQIRLVQGSDARSEYNATVEFSLHNRSKHKLLLYFRREFVTFRIVGPNGVVYCNPGPDTRAPDPQSFFTLKPGASRTYTSRLEELCSRETFDIPGLYLVNARYDATESGAQWNLALFTGSVASKLPANVRIRTGELPLLHKFTPAHPETRTMARAASANARPFKFRNLVHHHAVDRHPVVSAHEHALVTERQP